MMKVRILESHQYLLYKTRRAVPRIDTSYRLARSGKGEERSRTYSL